MGPVPRGNRCRWIPPRPNFPLNLASQANNKGPKRGRRADCLFPCQLKGFGGPLFAPRDSPSIYLPAVPTRPARSGCPSTGDNDGRTKRLPPGAQGTADRTEHELDGAWVQEEPAPKRGRSFCRVSLRRAPSGGASERARRRAYRCPPRCSGQPSGPGPGTGPRGPESASCRHRCQRWWSSPPSSTPRRDGAGS
jgi:hypothetical protein